MGIPKKRKSKSATRQRRSHHALKATNVAVCRKCGKPVKPHHACLNCGYYNGREEIDVMKKLSKAERRKAEHAKSKEEKKAVTETKAEQAG